MYTIHYRTLQHNVMKQTSLHFNAFCRPLAGHLHSKVARLQATVARAQTSEMVHQARDSVAGKRVSQENRSRSAPGCQCGKSHYLAQGVEARAGPVLLQVVDLASAVFAIPPLARCEDRKQISWMSPEAWRTGTCSAHSCRSRQYLATGRTLHRLWTSLA